MFAMITKISQALQCTDNFSVNSSQIKVSESTFSLSLIQDNLKEAVLKGILLVFKLLTSQLLIYQNLRKSFKHEVIHKVSLMAKDHLELNMNTHAC